MPFTAPVVAFSDHLGYLRCAKCAQGRDDPGEPMHADNSALYGDGCEVCGRIFTDALKRAA